MRTLTLPCLSILFIVAIVNSGCSISSIKEENRRLKEANDHLISENNRLERELEESRTGIGLSPATASTSPGLYDRPPATTDDEDLVARMKAQLDEAGVPSSVDVTRSSRGVHLRLPERVFFALGQAKLSKQGQGILERISRTLNSSYRTQMIRVDGHTDDTPIRKVRHMYPTNWELSTARACTVVRYLVDRCDVGARRIFPAGFSYYRPVAHGRSENARRQNRRVELTILYEEV